MMMHPELRTLLEKDRHNRHFNASNWIQTKCTILLEYLKKHHITAVCVNISGGVDSAVTIGLAHYAMKMEGSCIKRVVGITQPIHSTKSIWERAFECKHAFPGIEIITVDQSKIYDDLRHVVDNSIGITGNTFATGQLKSYMRTPVAFYTAQLLSQSGTPCLVIGTGNKDEDGYLFYFCKAGDGVADIQLISDLHKSEVFAVGRALGVPQTILNAPPSADLWDGQTDEGELGFSYDFVELWTEFLGYGEERKEEFRKGCSEEAWRQFEEWGRSAEAVHLRNKHKEKYPLNL